MDGTIEDGQRLAASVFRVSPLAASPAMIAGIEACLDPLLAHLEASPRSATAQVPLPWVVKHSFGVGVPTRPHIELATEMGVSLSVIRSALQRATLLMREELGKLNPKLLMLAQSATEQVDHAFWAKVERSGGPDSCWEWQGARDLGYGVLRRNGVKQQAHRYAFTLAGEELDPDLHLIHTCRTRACVNPAHLIEVLPGMGVDRFAHTPRRHNSSEDRPQRAPKIEPCNPLDALIVDARRAPRGWKHPDPTQAITDDERERVSQALGGMDDRQRTLLTRRYGLDGRPVASLVSLMDLVERSTETATRNAVWNALAQLAGAIYAPSPPPLGVCVALATPPHARRPDAWRYQLVPIAATSTPVIAQVVEHRPRYVVIVRFADPNPEVGMVSISVATEGLVLSHDPAADFAAVASWPDHTAVIDGLVGLWPRLTPAQQAAAQAVVMRLCDHLNPTLLSALVLFDHPVAPATSMASALLNALVRAPESLRVWTPIRALSSAMQQVIGAAAIAALPLTDHARWRAAALAAHELGLQLPPILNRGQPDQVEVVATRNHLLATLQGRYALIMAVNANAPRLGRRQMDIMVGQGGEAASG